MEIVDFIIAGFYLGCKFWGGEEGIMESARAKGSWGKLPRKI